MSRKRILHNDSGSCSLIGLFELVFDGMVGENVEDVFRFNSIKTFKTKNDKQRIEAP